MNKNKHLLNEQEKQKITGLLEKELSKRNEIIFAYLHGSFILPVPCGDIDIAVYLQDSSVVPGYWEYEAKLSMLLDRLVGLPVDILTLNCAPVTIRYHATCGKVLISKNEETRLTFLEATWREYFDYQPYLKAYYHDLLNS
ncbi:nucleotidyltransferase domain-containing protein [Desulfotruncus alcoholivorax]|uniref:nucleotidyltransferase domain-containing protein n=1 Tax=Desulfotruncus alcoholivorax TaxID=265477 RepID=UPI0004187D98|nr:nucleotidyltransferase domain-containing protein [Desulfotruncus alcoholivorax]